MQRTPSFSLGDRGGDMTGGAPSPPSGKKTVGRRTRKGSSLFLLMAGATIALLATPAMADIAVVGSEARRGGGDEEIMKASLKVNHHDADATLLHGTANKDTNLRGTLKEPSSAVDGRAVLENLESYPAQGGEEEEEEKVGEHHDEELQKYNEEEPAPLDAEEDEVLPIDIEEADKEELEEYFDEEEGYDEEPFTDEEELVEEEYEDYRTLPFGEDMINPFGYHERLTDLEKCFMHNYNTFYHDDNGSPVSNIPVPEENFNEGFFVQDVTEESCALDENGKSTNPSCFQAGSSTYCESCIFNVTMFKATFGNSYKGFHPCRNEISIIAEKCKETDCIQVRPTVEQVLDLFPTSSSKSSNMNTTANDRRNLLYYSDILGNNKKRWMTALQDNLGSGGRELVTLRDFVLPGSHNSAAVKMAADWCNDGAHLDPDSRNRVAKCQEEWGGLRKQLDEGIRYLDLRVVNSANFHGRKYPLHHSYLIDSNIKTMDDALREMDWFLSDNPEEFVIARIKYRTCDNDNYRYGGIDNEFERIMRARPRIQRFTHQTLGLSLTGLRGKIFIDMNGWHQELYAADKGVDGPEYKFCDGNPFEVARYLGDSKNRDTADRDTFNIWSFFPAASGSQLRGTVFWLGCDGLEDWDSNFQKHVWLTHSLILHYGANNVNAILRDRALTNMNIYHQATQLTLYRVFDKVHKQWPDLQGWNKVLTHEYVNYHDEKFEHKCPDGWFLSGLQSYHYNHKEDRIWKFTCTRAQSGFLYGGYFWSYWDGQKSKIEWNKAHHNIWWKNSDGYTANSWDNELNYGRRDCGIAITGIGSVHNSRREDRRFWFYVSVVHGPHSSQCTWTGWVNNYDGGMDFDVGIGNKRYISLLQSVHHNRHEDRRWRFCLCDSHVQADHSFARIRNKRVSNMYINLAGGSTNNRSPVVLWRSNNSKDQQWHLKADGTIRSSVDSSMCLEAGINPSLHTKVFLWKCDGGSWQKWTRQDSGRLKNRRHGYYLGVAWCGERASISDIKTRALELRRYENGDCGEAQKWIVS